MTAPIDYKFELVCKPLYLFRQKNNIRKQVWLKRIQVSAFFQKVSWKDANIDGLKFSKFMSPDFQTTYSADYHFGFTFRIGIYWCAVFNHTFYPFMDDVNSVLFYDI